MGGGASVGGEELSAEDNTFKEYLGDKNKMGNLENSCDKIIIGSSNNLNICETQKNSLQTLLLHQIRKRTDYKELMLQIYLITSMTDRIHLSKIF